MLNERTLQDILDRLRSPTYGAPSSELQIVALQECTSSTSQPRALFDNLKPSHVATLQNTIQQLGEDAAVILALHAAIQKRIQQAKTYYQNATAALAPINRFPAEVLARIFVAGKHLEINFCPRVSWVAKRWRDIALSTPELWNRIPLTSLARVSTYLERGGTTPLDIEVDARTYKVNTFTLRQSLQLLQQHMHRWRNVKVLVEEHELAQLVIRPLEDLCRRANEGLLDNQLSTIRLGVPYSPGLISDTYSSFLGIHPVPTLRVIELLDVNLVCTPVTSPSIFEQMRILSLSSIENMHLETHLFNALSSMPNLASLILDQCAFVTPQLGGDPHPDIVLNDLATLELSHISDEIANLIFSRIYAPNVTRLGWYSRALDGPSSIIRWASIRARYINLTILKLRNVTSHATKHIIRWLEDLPNLLTLSVIFGELLSPQRVAKSADELLQLLSKSNSPCCPRLCRLTIGDLDERGLARLQATLQAKKGLQTGKVSAALQPITWGSKKRREFMEWANERHFNVKIYEFDPNAAHAEDDREDETDDSEGEQID